MPAEHWTTFCHLQQTRLQMTSRNWWLTLIYFATFLFCKIFRIFKPSDALKMFSTIEADFQTDWNKCPENGGKSSRGLPEVTKVNLWNFKRQKKHLVQVLCQRRWWSSIVFLKKPTIDFFGWVELIEIDGGQITGHQEEITRWGKDKVSWWKMDEYRV